MPSLSSFALAFPMRSDCLLAHSGLRFPSSTYFMATSTSCDLFARRTMQLSPFGGPAPMPFRIREPRTRLLEASHNLAEVIRQMCAGPLSDAVGQAVNGFGHSAGNAGK